MSDPFEEGLAELTEEEAAEHIGDIMFDSAGEVEPDCLLCVLGRRLGLFERYGVNVDDIWPASPSQEKP